MVSSRMLRKQGNAHKKPLRAVCGCRKGLKNMHLEVPRDRHPELPQVLSGNPAIVL
jgi:hypothetical protein